MMNVNGHRRPLLLMLAAVGRNIAYRCDFDKINCGQNDKAGVKFCLFPAADGGQDRLAVHFHLERAHAFDGF